MSVCVVLVFSLQVCELQWLGVILILLVIVYGLFIFGVGFVVSDQVLLVLILDVIFSQIWIVLMFKQVDFFVQVSQVGGGDYDKVECLCDNQVGIVLQLQIGLLLVLQQCQDVVNLLFLQVCVISSCNSFDSVVDVQL